MAYNETLATRIADNLKSRNIPFESKKMMGGLTFMVNGKMCVGIFKENLMARVGPDAYEHALTKPDCKPMDFTGKPLKGYVYISKQGYQSSEDLNDWIQLCLDFNPKAKASKKRK